MEGRRKEWKTWYRVNKFGRTRVKRQVEQARGFTERRVLFGRFEVFLALYRLSRRPYSQRNANVQASMCTQSR